jgi:hypothetical protein
MMNEPLMSQDAVLGGDNPAPLHGLVLGGLGGLQQRFETGDETAKLAALVGAISFGDEAIALLSHALAAESLQVRAAAYGLLKQIGSEAAIVAAGVGIPLKVGDRIYGVYRSSISYGDDWYYIDSSINDSWKGFEDAFYSAVYDAEDKCFYVTDEPKKILYHVHDEEQDLHYYEEEIYGYDDETYTPKLASYHLNHADALIQTECEFKQAFSSVARRFLEIDRNDYPDDFDIPRWCQQHNIKFSPKRDEGSWYAQAQLLEELYKQGEINLLYELWPQFGYDPLAFVHEHTIKRPCYLKLTKV